ncbi:histidine-rich glycoprotein-like [Cucumis melo var. makuwa]|uniref:Histidine-rich glycoprotein-like n=1 Tax=Cucumis melo var. makuwa TaxID=1194695 RepID=A0A5D3CD94_CUCMM|nr:histidine-rich glycoprotein-like [Cucumis melo var. makuwa]
MIRHFPSDPPPYQIHHLGRSDRPFSSFGEVTLSSAIQRLRGDQERSTIFIVWRRDSAISDPTSSKGRSDICHQIHPFSRSDWKSSLFGEVTLPSVIQLLLGEDRAFVVRSIALVGAIGHLRQLERTDRTSSSFGEVTPLSVIQLLLRDYRAFTVNSTTLIEATGIFVVWIGDSTVSDPTSTRGRSSIYRQIHCHNRSDQASSSFGKRDREKAAPSSSFEEKEEKLYRCHLREEEAKLHHYRHLREREAKLHHRRHLVEAKSELRHHRPLRATTCWR